MIEMVGVSAGRAGGLQLIECTLAVAPGRITAVVGSHRSGADLIPGILMGRRRAARGVSQVMGFDCAHDAAEVRRRLSYVPRGGALDGALSVRRQLVWWMGLIGVEAAAADVRRALRAVEIPDRYFDQPAASVPAECHVLAWLALVLMRRHRVVLLEHPTAATSFQGADRIASVLRDLRQDGACVLITTDDVRFTELAADDVVFIDQGRQQPVASSLP